MQMDLKVKFTRIKENSPDCKHLLGQGIDEIVMISKKTRLWRAVTLIIGACFRPADILRLLRGHLLLLQ